MYGIHFLAMTQALKNLNVNIHYIHTCIYTHIHTRIDNILQDINIFLYIKHCYSLIIICEITIVCRMCKALRRGLLYIIQIIFYINNIAYTIHFYTP